MRTRRCYVTTIDHNVSVDDDEAQVLALCTCGWAFKSTDRNHKLEEIHTHLADVFRQARLKEDA